MGYTKNFNKRRPRRVMKKGRKPLNMGQLKAINTIVSRSINKSREMKYYSTRFDEDPVPMQTGNRFILHTGGEANMFNISQGSSSAQRVGNEVNIMGFEFKGHLVVNGQTAAQEQREVTTRVVFGFVREGTALNMTDLAFIGGQPVNLPSDYSAIYCDFNWAKFRPIHEKVFKLAPANFYQDGALNQIQTIGNVPDCKIIKYAKRFGKKGMPIQFKDSLTEYANRNNLVMLVISRNANDDLTTSILNIEVCGVCNVRYTDS